MADSTIITIRQEQSSDYPKVFDLIEKAFRNEELSDHKEHFLVQRLRNNSQGAFVPELSLVAEAEGQGGKTILVGHILLTKIQIVLDGNNSRTYESLALAPVSVLPSHQRRGIGGKLIRHAHSVAKSLGYQSVVLLGHDQYYPKFGYRQCQEFGFFLPFEGIPPENCMAIELTPNALQIIRGGVVEFSNSE